MHYRGLVVTGLMLASVGRTFAYDENVDALIKTVLARGPAMEVPCGRAPEGAGPMTARVCARATTDFNGFKEAWDRHISSDASPSTTPKPLTEWLPGLNGWIRWYGIGETWLVVSFDKADSKILITYPKHRDGVFTIGEGITPPKRISHEMPRSKTISDERGGLKRGAQGVVVLSAVVHKDGAVSNVEVLGCVSRNRGLEQAAVRMLKKWRYEPARINGEPIDVAMNATISFGATSSYGAAEGNDYAGSSGGAGRGSGLN